MSKLTQAVQAIASDVYAVMNKVPAVEGTVIAMEVDDYIERLNGIVQFNGSHDDRDLDGIAEVRRLERTGTTAVFASFEGLVNYEFSAVLEEDFQEVPSLLVTRDRVNLTVEPCEFGELPARNVTWLVGADGHLSEPTATIIIPRGNDQIDLRSEDKLPLVVEALVSKGMIAMISEANDHSVSLTIIDGADTLMADYEGGEIMDFIAGYVRSHDNTAAPRPM